MEKIKKPCFAWFGFKDFGIQKPCDCKLTRKTGRCGWSTPSLWRRFYWSRCSWGKLSPHYQQYLDLKKCPWCSGELEGGKDVS